MFTKIIFFMFITKKKISKRKKKYTKLALYTLYCWQISRKENNYYDVLYIVVIKTNDFAKMTHYGEKEYNRYIFVSYT